MRLRILWGQCPQPLAARVERVMTINSFWSDYPDGTEGKLLALRNFCLVDVGRGKRRS